MQFNSLFACIIHLLDFLYGFDIIRSYKILAGKLVILIYTVYYYRSCTFYILNYRVDNGIFFKYLCRNRRGIICDIKGENPRISSFCISRICFNNVAPNGNKAVVGHNVLNGLGHILNLSAHNDFSCILVKR